MTMEGTRRPGPGVEGKDLNGMRVLLVGRSSGICGDVAACLRAAGCTVHDSGHASDALHRMEAAVDAAVPFAVVMVDESLSGVDALLFASLVREDDRLSSPRLILLARNNESAFGRYAAAGYVARLSVPVDPSSLTGLLGTVPTSSPAPTSDPEFETEKPGTAENARASILLVEDNDINMEVAREMIERIGYRCDHAVNGYEAVEAVTQHRYALVLMDCQMPGMDGYEATRRIRSWEERHHGDRHVPIVAVTAHAMKGDRERCLATGMDDYMTKPVEVDRLAATIARWLVRPEP